MYSTKQIRAGILLPQLSLLRNALFINPFFDAVKDSMVLTYPLSLYVRDDSGRIRWLGFIYAFLFTRKNGKKSVQITYPLSFDDMRKEQLFERLLEEVKELASDFGADQIEAEAYRNISGNMFEPLSSVAFGNVPNFEFLRFLETRGFQQEESKSCYQIKWSSHIWKPDSVREYTISDLTQRKKQYLELLQLSDSYIQSVYPDHLNTLPPPVTQRFYFKEEWVIFTQSNMEKCCLRWFPQSIFNKRMEKEAKVVRMLCGKASSDVICRSLAAGFNTIGSHGIDTLQIADIAKGSDVESFLTSRGAFKVYETVTMVLHC
ncbi:MAG: hypothetical protein HXS42_03290 [Theionarchaea archaeon]|nr:hypothetical protein [Theionarchaea archaeon]